MSHKRSLKLYLAKPIVGSVGVDDRSATWSISEIECLPLDSSQAPPPHDLASAVHRRMRDGDGNAIPVEVLASFDLQAGFREAFRQQVAIAQGAGS